MGLGRTRPSPNRWLRDNPKIRSLPGIPDSGFDLVLIDGAYWVRCAETAIGTVKPNGCVHLDNADAACRTSGSLIPRMFSLEAARSQGGWHGHMTDFTPNYLVVAQGFLVRL